MKKLIAFDLDGTLAPSKSAMPDRLAGLMAQLLEKYELCVISGGKFEQFEKQVLSNLKVDAGLLTKMHLMPTCGTRYVKFNPDTKRWHIVYKNDIPDGDKSRIREALNKGFEELKYAEKKVYGEIVEDRLSQMTYSVFGQDIVDVLGEEGVAIKEAWDPDNTKKIELRNHIAPLIPDYEVRVGGVTSIDVTLPGVDKAYGMEKLLDEMQLQKEEVLFIGDKLFEGGNDYPVKVMGIDCIAIKEWEDTAYIIEGILGVTK